jgi:hypothetical protein
VRSFKSHVYYLLLKRTIIRVRSTCTIKSLEDFITRRYRPDVSQRLSIRREICLRKIRKTEGLPQRGRNQKVLHRMRCWIPTPEVPSSLDLLPAFNIANHLTECCLNSFYTYCTTPHLPAAGTSYETRKICGGTWTRNGLNSLHVFPICCILYPSYRCFQLVN